jgi:serine/threonine protein kinase
VGKFEDEYSVLGVIHNGGEQCRVMTILCKDDNKVYVVKRQHKHYLRNRNEELFRRMTLRLMNMAENDHLAQIHRCLEDRAYFYTVQERLDGGNLLNFLNVCLTDDMDDATLEKEVRQVMGELLLNLQHLHKLDLIHKDVKLENVVFKNRGAYAPLPSWNRRESVVPDEEAPVCRIPAELKLIDFDFTNAWEPDRRHKDVLGTDGYIAPEAYRGVVCPKSDIFSAGVVMYNLIAKRCPYPRELFDDGPEENYVGSAKMNEIHDKLRNYKIHFGRPWKHMDQAKNFCKSLLEVDVSKRPSAEEAMKHPWMANFAGKAKSGQRAGTTKKHEGARTTVAKYVALPVL